MAKREVKNNDINDKSAKVKTTSATKNNKTITKSKDVKSNLPLLKKPHQKLKLLFQKLQL